MTASPASANIRTQIGVEVTPGTGVAATQQLAGLYFTDDPKISTMQTRRQGHASPSASVRGQGFTDLTPTSDFADFNSITYALASILGIQTAVLHDAGTTAYDWPFLLKLTDLILGQTYTVERGPTGSGLGRKYDYVAIDALTLTGTKDKLTISAGHAFGREIITAATLTSSVPELAAVSMAGVNTNVFLDTTYGGIGTTPLILSEWTIALANFFGPKYDVNRTITTYDKLVPLIPTVTVTLKVEADADANAFYAYLKAGQMVFPRIDVQGPIVIGEASIKNELILDMGLFISAPAAFGDDQGIDSIVFTGVVGEDETDGVSLLATLTNVLATL